MQLRKSNDWLQRVLLNTSGWYESFQQLHAAPFPLDLLCRIVINRKKLPDEKKPPADPILEGGHLLWSLHLMFLYLWPGSFHELLCYFHHGFFFKSWWKFKISLHHVGCRKECLVKMPLKATNDEKLVCQQELEIYVFYTSLCVLWRDASGAGNPEILTSKWKLIRIRKPGRIMKKRPFASLKNTSNGKKRGLRSRTLTHENVRW